MDNLTIKIAESFVKDHPSWKEKPGFSKMTQDLEYILHFAKCDKLVFKHFIGWQTQLLASINVPFKSFRLLCEKAIEIGEKELDSTSLKNLSVVLESSFNAELHITEESLPAQIANHHASLFSLIHPKENLDDTSKSEKDAEHILNYLDSRDPETFLKFLVWQVNLLEVIGMSKLSLIRFLVTIQLFVDDSKSALIKKGILHLMHEDVQTQYLVSGITPDEIPNAITDFHIKLFQEADAFSSEKYRQNMVDDAEKHLDFLDQSFQSESEVLFIEYTSWTRSTLQSLGIESMVLVRFLISMRSILNCTDLKLKVPYLDSGIKSLLSLGSIDELRSDSYIDSEEARQYLNFLITGKRKEATKLIVDLVDQGMELKKIYMDIFQKSQYEIGRLWEKNEVSVAQEHFCTATTQMIMSMLYPRLFSSKNTGKSVVATCVGSELHEIGVRMVADFLEMEGWDTYYVGANTPIPAVIDAIEKHNADLVAISVTLVPHVKKAEKLIQEIKLKFPSVKIMIGGYPFIQDPELHKKIKADGFVKSADSVHSAAISLVNG